MTFRLPLQVLLVDDDANIRRTLALSLKDLQCAVEQADSVQAAMAIFQARPFDLVLTDFKMEKQSGLQLIQQARALRPDALIVMMTAYASYENAVEVVREGAFDYLPKPFTTAQLSHLLSKVREVVTLRRENQELKRGRARRDYFSGFTSIASQRLEEFVRKVAPTDGTVLLTGESGTGKSELAKLIHELSPRAKNPFVTVYCTTLTESLLESELFGHIKGSFTGAVADKAGKLELADGGTLFLDEVGDLTPNGQTKLLRFLQERVFERVGGNREVSVDARIIAATNRDLPQAVAAGKFREDLYYRLNVLECILVPLRHRREDVPVLIERILGEISGGKTRTLPPGLMEPLLRYHWPGNIRELRNVLERVLMLCQGRAPQAADLPDALLKPAAETDGVLESLSLEEIEKRHIQRVLSRAENLEKAAEILGITTVTLWRKRKEYGIP
ncbi:MAG TPA: sigma-54 dependent transcriptional regulator [Bdellovibrionota bacterium]|nr:sigma-54 dependent transcriptional regulator [Bdellovibrionota bacterium]